MKVIQVDINDFAGKGCYILDSSGTERKYGTIISINHKEALIEFETQTNFVKNGFYYIDGVDFKFLLICDRCTNAVSMKKDISQESFFKKARKQGWYISENFEVLCPKHSGEQNK